MSKKVKYRPYTKAIESGIWWDEEKQEHNLEAFFDAFTRELAAAPLEGKVWVMKDYGIWFGPQR